MVWGHAIFGNTRKGNTTTQNPRKYDSLLARPQPPAKLFRCQLGVGASVRGIHIFGVLFSENIGVRQSERLAPKINQSTGSLDFLIRQNNPNRKFCFKVSSHNMPLHDSPRNESHRSVIGVRRAACF